MSYRVYFLMMITSPSSQIQLAIAWCLAYVPNSPNNHQTRKALRQYFYHQQPCEGNLNQIISAVSSLATLKFPGEVADLQKYIDDPVLGQRKIGLVYGGATKIKSYVFDVPKLHEIRGASALLDNINLVDLPAFFHADESQEQRFQACCNAEPSYCQSVRTWLQDEGFQELEDALIHELIIYSTGGNILAFCPPDLVVTLANAIEKRYTTETLVANSCAVGQAYKPLEIRFGCLPDYIPNNFFWLPDYQQNAQDDLVQVYLKLKPSDSPEQIVEKFENHKSFNELTSQLAILFNQRRAGNEVPDRPSRSNPAMFETHPYLRRDNAEKRLAVLQADLPDAPWYSEVSARKRLIGQIAKREQKPGFQAWYQSLKPKWDANPKAESWVKRFMDYLEKRENAELHSLYYGGKLPKIDEAQTVGEIGNASKPDKYIGYIYADANNMGGYIQGIKTPEDYRQFSEDISRITEESVYEALAKHLTIHQLQRFTNPERYHDDGEWIHPFEIITVGGDDVFLIVPANKALQIAHTLGITFEQKLLGLEHGKHYHVKPKHPDDQTRPVTLIHRYHPKLAESAMSQLSMSIGVLITSEDTPITYAENLTTQLLKSAKEKAKQLKQPCEYQGTVYKQGYHGGTIDFQVLKSVTMISSKISEFRKDGLVKTYEHRQTHNGEKPKDLHLYATPYTLHEIGGLLKLIAELKKVDFPKSQLYQIRSFLEKGKRTTILNYRYFRVRLKLPLQAPLKEFEESWCKADSNNGNIAPWMYYTELPDPTRPPKEKPKSYYETIWRELVELYEFIPKPDPTSEQAKATATAAGVAP
jgi:CRISPR-associated protein Cmr2